MVITWTVGLTARPGRENSFIAIANELTETEIEHAFGWNARAQGGPDAEIREHPLVPYLRPEQVDRLREELEAII